MKVVRIHSRALNSVHTDHCLVEQHNDERPAHNASGTNPLNKGRRPPSIYQQKQRSAQPGYAKSAATSSTRSNTQAELLAMIAEAEAEAKADLQYGAPEPEPEAEPNLHHNANAEIPSKKKSVSEEAWAEIKGNDVVLQPREKDKK